MSSFWSGVLCGVGGMWLVQGLGLLYLLRRADDSADS